MTKEGGKYQLMVKYQEMKKIDDEEDENMTVEAVQEQDERNICMLMCSLLFMWKFLLS